MGFTIGNNFNNFFIDRLNGTGRINGNGRTNANNGQTREITGYQEPKSLADIEAEYAAAEAAWKAQQAENGEGTDAAKGAEEAQGTEAAQGTQATTTTQATNEETEAIAAEIEKLEEEKAANEEKMEEIEAKIEELAASAEKHIMEAAAAQEAISEEYQEESQQVLSENINAYIEANKEGGEGMTREELQANIQNSMPNAPGVGAALAALTAASEEVSEIDSYLGELNQLIQDTQAITESITAKQGEFQAATAAAEAEAACDPIGFTATDAEGNQAQYDFIVDDGAFDSTSDFLGASDQWNEMAALDADGDMIVSAEELAAGNIKAVKTNADGSQEIVSLAEEFGEDFSIDLNSYQQGGSHSAVDTNSDSDGDGTADQTLLGTFNVNINGESVQGYNTLDDVDWLSENYGITSSTTAVEEAETGLNAENFSEDLSAHVNFFNMYTEKSEELKAQINEAYENLGMNEEQVNGLNEISKTNGNNNANEFLASLNTSETNEEGLTTQEATTEATEEVAEEGLTTLPATTEATESEKEDEEDIYEKLLELDPSLAA